MNDQALAGDLLRGAAAIAAELGVTRRAAKHLCIQGEIPAFKIGSRWCARRSTLRAFIAAVEGRALAAANGVRRRWPLARRSRAGRRTGARGGAGSGRPGRW